MSATDFTPIICLTGLIALVLWSLRQAKAYHDVPIRPRADQRIPTEDMNLLGLDYRDSVRPYFHRRLEQIERKRGAILSITGIDIGSEHAGGK
jgi:hypothetical protein